MSVAFYIDTKPLKRGWNLGISDNGISGTDTMIISVVLQLAKRGVDVVLYATSPPTTGAGDVDIVSVACFGDAVRKSQEKKDEFFIFAIKSTKEELDAIKLSKGNIKYVGWAHNTPASWWLREAGEMEDIYKIIAVSVTQAVSWAHRSAYLKTAVIPNFVLIDDEVKILPFNKREKNIVYVGALRESKGFHHVADAWLDVWSKNKELKLIVAGSSKLYSEEIKTGPAGLSDPDYERRFLGSLGGSVNSARQFGVEFLGAVEKRRLYSLIGASTATIVNPNLIGSVETFCMSAVESNLLKTPVISSSAGALPETVGNRRGGLLSKNKSGFVRNLLLIAENNDLRERLANSGYLAAKNRYSGNLSVEVWINLINNKKIKKSPYCELSVFGTKVFLKNVLRWTGLGDEYK